MIQPEIVPWFHPSEGPLWFLFLTKQEHYPLTRAPFLKLRAFRNGYNPGLGDRNALLICLGAIPDLQVGRNRDNFVPSLDGIVSLKTAHQPDGVKHRFIDGTAPACGDAVLVPQALCMRALDISGHRRSFIRRWHS
jgi:hypothetical protein